MANNEVDDVSGVETTGHDWDGIKELNNPLPRWWLWTFYLCIIWSIGYVAYYPAIPLIEGSTMGYSGETNRSVVEQDIAAAREKQAGLRARIESGNLEEIKSTDELYRFALAGGASLFKVNCSQCHGSGAQGAPGYPNLNDDDWLWGGDLQSIYTTIKHGVRGDEDENARVSEMPAFGDGVLEAEQIADVAQYVLKLAGKEADANAAARGAEIYTTNCASCHGASGEGVREFGGPKLADTLWLYGGTADEIAAQVKKPKHGVMPPWGGRLGEAGVKQLTIYVHSLGGGEKTAAKE
jgi:cytochrome c oxidase cbb3-type subunit III